VLFKYFKILIILNQSAYVRFSHYRAAWCTAKEMSGRVHFAKYIRDPTILLYIVGSKGLSLVILFSVQGVFFHFE